MIELECRICSKILTKPDGARFSDKPIEQWWEQDCASLCMGCRYSPEVGVARPVGSPQTLAAATDGQLQKAGAQVALPNAGTRCAAVLDALTEAGQDGMTYEELQDSLGLGYNNIGPRVRTLHGDGLVIRAPFTREARSGAQQYVWVAANADQTM